MKCTKCGETEIDDYENAVQKPKLGDLLYCYNCKGIDTLEVIKILQEKD